MEKRSIHTIQTLLEELKEGLPTLKKGMIFETLKSIFPTSEMPKEKRNLNYKGASFTKPLACNRKDKENYVKENSPLSDFFKEKTRGDFLEVVEVKGDTAYCVNVSLNENISEEFYKNETIQITYNDLAAGSVKIYRRKIDKFFE